VDYIGNPATERSWGFETLQLGATWVVAELAYAPEPKG
jgi:hypothetical protein